MVPQGVNHDRSFHAATGSALYDGIRFSVPPRAALIGQREGRLSVVRHVGLASGALVSSASANDAGDVISVNLSSGGHYERRVDGRTIRRPLRKSDISFVPQGLATEVMFPASNSAVLAVFAPEVLGTIAGPGAAGRLEPLHGEANRSLAQLVLLAEAELRSPGLASDIAIDGLITTIAALLSRTARAPFQVTDDKIHLSPVRLARVVDFIEANLHAELSLADLATVAQFSPFHFSRIFKRATGESPYQFVSSRRLDRARRLLCEGQLPLAELALCCGFSSQAHFTAAFTKAVGLSPGRYRRALTAG